MDWRDTVIKKHKYAEAQYMGDRFLQILSEQAEVSYKAGEDEGYNRGLSLLVKEEEGMCSRARQEVVDYLWDYTEFEHKGCDDDCNLQNVATIHIDWEEFKKDMGIKQ